MAKILSFKNSKLRKNYNLRLVINVSMEKDSNGTCRFGIDYNDEIVTEMELIKYLNNVLTVLSEETSQVEIQINARYNASFTIFYYETENKKDFKFIISPSSYSKKEIATYLYIVIVTYLDKK